MNLIPDNVSEKTNVFDVLKERGFIEQTTHEEEIRDLLERKKSVSILDSTLRQIAFMWDILCRLLL